MRRRLAGTSCGTVLEVDLLRPASRIIPAEQVERPEGSEQDPCDDQEADEAWGTAVSHGRFLFHADLLESRMAAGEGTIRVVGDAPRAVRNGHRGRLHSSEILEKPFEWDPIQAVVPSGLTEIAE